jgi:hypothetical protein
MLAIAILREALSSAEKFGVVVETTVLNALELGEYCHRKGLFAEQIATWRRTCRRANDPLPSNAEQAERRTKRAQITSLTRALQPKIAPCCCSKQKSGRSWEERADAPSPTIGVSRDRSGAQGRGWRPPAWPLD